MADSTPAAPRGRVLLIDDDRVFGLWATKVLQSRGFFVEHVLDPMTGLKQIEAEPWDMVITDVEMPRMSGIEFLDRMRRLEPTLPVVVVTAHPTVDRAVADTQPTVLYTHSMHDDQQDHRSAHQAALAAARRIGRVYCFQSPSATIDFRPTHFVAIDDQLSGKLQAVGAFTGQDEVRAFLEPDQVTSTALYWGRYCQAQHAEAFEVVRDG